MPPIVTTSPTDHARDRACRSRCAFANGQGGGLRAPALAKLLGTSSKNVERWLKQLKDQGKIEFKGVPKTGGFFAYRPNALPGD